MKLKRKTKPKKKMALGLAEDSKRQAGHPFGSGFPFGRGPDSKQRK